MSWDVMENLRVLLLALLFLIVIITAVFLGGKLGYQYATENKHCEEKAGE
jgi:uncharacterized membrane protein